MPKIVNLGTPSSQTVYTKKYDTFRGVDFSVSETMVDDSRSPHAVNLISDTGGFPEKRLGWRTLKQFDGRINGIFHYKGIIEEEAGEGEDATETLVETYIVHSGDKIYSWSGNEADEPTELLSGINNARSTGRFFKERLFILTGAEFLEFNGKECVRVEEGEGSYVPTTWEGRGTAAYGSETKVGYWDDPEKAGYGKTYQAVNIACKKRKNTFKILGGRYYERYIFLDGKIKAGTRIKMTYIPTGEVVLDVIAPEGQKEEYSIPKTETGFWIPGNEPTWTHGSIVIGREPYDTESKKVAKDLNLGSCGVIYGAMTPSAVEGYENSDGDNFCVEYVAEVGESENAISKCTVMDIFENRIFYSGNPDFPNTDWHSELNEPTYVTDLSYTEVGLEATAIIGYLRTGSEQAILKEDGEDATIYMRSYSTDSEGEVIFPIRQGTSGVGAVTSHAVCTLLDDPLYLSRNGVYAIAQQDISSERALNIRSTRVNNKLLKNKLEDAYMCKWKGYLLLFINGECYVADSGQKTYANNKTNTFEYEWYYWNNIPAWSALEYKGALFFGTDDGRFCRFNDDMTNSRGGYEMTAYSDDGAAIVAEWATPLSADNDFMRLKTMKKKGSGVMLKTYNRSGVRVCVKTDKEFEREIRSVSAGVFNFEDIDFSDFTFNTSEYIVVPFNAKFKKYKAIQIILRNDKVNQAFGVLGIIRRYVLGNFAK